MKLTNAGISNREEWIQKGYRLPEFDRKAVSKATKKAPYWVHFGNGNIFKAFQANVVQNLLNSEELDRGLIVAEGFDYEIVEKMNRPFDDLNILVTLKADGTIEKTVIGSVVESLILDSDEEIQFGRLKEIFRQDSLQMASFTITEKGYSLVDAKGQTLPSVTEDFLNGPDKPTSYIGKVAALLYSRYLVGEKPVVIDSRRRSLHLLRNGHRMVQQKKAFWTMLPTEIRCHFHGP